MNWEPLGFMWDVLSDVGTSAMNIWQYNDQKRFQREMSSSAYQRSVADMQKAGLNPAMMYGGSAGPAGVPIGSSITPTHSARSLGQGMMNAKLIAKQVENLEAQNRNLLADTHKKQSERRLNNALRIKTDWDAAGSIQDVNVKAEQGNVLANTARNLEAEFNRIRSSTAGQDLENLLKKWQAEFGQKGEYGLKVAEAILRLLGK